MPGFLVTGREDESPRPLRLSSPISEEASPAEARSAPGSLPTSQEGSLVASPRDEEVTSKSAPATSSSSGSSPSNGTSTPSSPRRLKFFPLTRRSGSTGPSSVPSGAPKGRKHSGSPMSVSPPGSGAVSPSELMTPDGPSPRDHHEDPPPPSSSSSTVAAAPLSSSLQRLKGSSSKSTESIPAAPAARRSSAVMSASSASPSKKEAKALERARRKEEAQRKKILKVERRQQSLKAREVQELVDMILETSYVFPVESLLSELPRLPLRVRKLGDPVSIVSGPTAQDELMTLNEPGVKPVYSRDVAARSTSTYPMGKGLPQRRDGAPICDSFLSQSFRDGCVISCLADGCGWGPRNREAAIKAKVALADHIFRRLPSCRDVHSVAEMLLKGLGESHYKIIEGKEDVSSAGTTTILGGVLVPIEKTALSIFMFVSVGDCKAFVRKQVVGGGGRIIDLNMNARSNVSDAKDPGGRIGPFIKQELPDLRNLKIGYCICEEGDLVILTSDGVTDNLDPEYQAVKPSECGMPGIDSWEAISKDQVEFAIKCKAEWRCTKMCQVIDAFAAEQGVAVCPEVVVHSLIGYCISLTRPSRDWLESTMTGQLPCDYVVFPGKQDHTTCVCIRILAPVVEVGVPGDRASEGKRVVSSIGAPPPKPQSK